MLFRSLTVSGTTISFSRFTIDGTSLKFLFKVSGTTGGSVGPSLSISLPVNAKSTSNYPSPGECHVYDYSIGGDRSGFAFFESVSLVSMVKYNVTNFGAGGLVRAYGNFSYEI